MLHLAGFFGHGAYTGKAWESNAKGFSCRERLSQICRKFGQNQIRRFMTRGTLIRPTSSRMQCVPF
jgi:hypothetical protein